MRQHRIKKELDILPSSLSVEYEPTSTTYLQIPRTSHGGRIEKQSSEPPIPTQFSIDEPSRLSPVQTTTSSSPQFLVVPGSNIPPPGPLQKQRSQPLLPSQMSITQAYSPMMSTAPIQRQSSQPPIHIAHSPPVITAQPAFQISQGGGKPPVQVHYLQATPVTTESRRLTGSPSIVIEQYPPTTSSPARVMRIEHPVRIISTESMGIKMEPDTVVVSASSPVTVSTVEIPKPRLAPLRPKDSLSKSSSPQASLESPGSDSQRLVHCPVLRPGPALGCNFCWNTVDAHGRILRRKTKYCCPECQTNLCIVPCFQQYHQRYDGANKNNSVPPAPTASSASV